jgi:hypothetical protein
MVWCSLTCDRQTAFWRWFKSSAVRCALFYLNRERVSLASCQSEARHDYCPSHLLSVLGAKMRLRKWRVKNCLDVEWAHSIRRPLDQLNTRSLSWTVTSSPWNGLRVAPLLLPTEQHEIWGSHSSIVEDAGTRICDAVSLGEVLPAVLRKVVPSSSGVKQSKMTLQNEVETLVYTHPATTRHFTKHLNAQENDSVCYLHKYFWFVKCVACWLITLHGVGDVWINGTDGGKQSTRRKTWVSGTLHPDWPGILAAPAVTGRRLAVWVTRRPSPLNPNCRKCNSAAGHLSSVGLRQVAIQETNLRNYWVLRRLAWRANVLRTVCRHSMCLGHWSTRGEATGLAGCSPRWQPPPSRAKFKKHGFCRYYDIKSFTWFMLQLKSATEICWWLAHWNFEKCNKNLTNIRLFSLSVRLNFPYNLTSCRLGDCDMVFIT